MTEQGQNLVPSFEENQHRKPRSEKIIHSSAYVLLKMRETLSNFNHHSSLTN